mmetsp:Transcript_27946/g.55888  ORF Transcript_27946/g.55888 Transcript_27946/m.55888 type:complete len:104 (-) Transcript_27946:134-445(-)
MEKYFDLFKEAPFCGVLGKGGVVSTIVSVGRMNVLSSADDPPKAIRDLVNGGIVQVMGGVEIVRRCRRLDTGQRHEGLTECCNVNTGRRGAATRIATKQHQRR